MAGEMNLRQFREITEALGPAIEQTVKKIIHEDNEELLTQVREHLEDFQKSLERVEKRIDQVQLDLGTLTKKHGELEMSVVESKAKIAGIAAATGGIASVLAWGVSFFWTSWRK